MYSFTAVQMAIIADIINWFLSTMSDEKLFCIRSYWKQNFTVAVFSTRWGGGRRRGYRGEIDSKNPNQDTVVGN